MLVAMVPIIFIILGAFVYILAANPKAQELGKLTFAAGMFALLFTLAGRLVHFL